MLEWTADRSSESDSLLENTGSLIGTMYQNSNGWKRKLSGKKLLALLFCAFAGSSDGADAPKSDVKRTAIDRFKQEHLQATHSDAEMVRKGILKRTLPAGWRDIRSIFHAHAEDSEHTGGTRPEMIAEANKSGVSALFLSDHYRPPRDFVTPERSGLVDGVLLVPGSEWGGFLLLPTKSVISKMKAPANALLDQVRENNGLAFLSHVEERQNHSMEQLDGQEIYNRHYDAIVDSKGLMSLVLAMTSRKTIDDFQQKIDKYPDETFAFQVEYPKLYLEKFDRELIKKRLVGVAANDCHHNMVLIVKKVDETAVLVGTNVDKDQQMKRIPVSLAPGIKELVANKKPGDVIAKIDLDPYHRSFAGSSTHIFAKSLTDNDLRLAVKAGRVYVSHDWICNPEGFWVEVQDNKNQVQGMIGDELKFNADQGQRIKVEMPASASLVRLICDGQVVGESTNTAKADFKIEKPGVYRVEVFQKLDGEYRGWIYANPIYIRAL